MLRSCDFVRGFRKRQVTTLMTPSCNVIYQEVAYATDTMSRHLIRVPKFSKKFQPFLTIQTIFRLSFHKVECTPPPYVTSCQFFINSYFTYKWLKQVKQNEIFHSFHWLLAKKTGTIADKGKVICNQMLLLRVWSLHPKTIFVRTRRCVWVDACAITLHSCHICPGMNGVDTYMLLLKSNTSTYNLYIYVYTWHHFGLSKYIGENSIQNTFH